MRGPLLSIGRLAIYTLLLFYVLATVQPARGSTSGLASPDAPVSLAEGDDYAKTVLRDPWDMNEITDIRQERSFNLTNISVANGVLTAVSGTDSNPNNVSKDPSNPQIYLLYPGYVGAQDIGKLGVNFPINATKYRQLSFRMDLEYSDGNSHPDDVAGVYWATDKTFTQYGYTKKIPVQPGWHTYVIDLATANLDAGSGCPSACDTPWGSGYGTSIQALRLDPTSLAGVTISLDWVRLTPPDTSATTTPVTWSGSGNVASLYASLCGQEPCADDHYAPIALGVTNTLSYSWGTSALPSGTYYARTETGSDWATMVRGDTWDMAETGASADIYTTGSFAPQNTSVSFSGGLLSGSTTGTDNNDPPSVFLAFSPYAPIDGSDFYKLTLRLDKPAGYAYEVAWTTADAPAGTWYSYWIGDTTGGMYTYNLDMRTPPSPNSPQPWAGHQITYLRIDPIRAEGGSTIMRGLPWQIEWVGLIGGGPEPETESDLQPKSISFSAGSVTVNNAPYISIDKPSMTSGPDYATSWLNDPWDMNSAADMPSLTGITGIISHGQRTSCGDFSHDDIGNYSFDSNGLNATTYGTPCPDPVVGSSLLDSDVELWLNTGICDNLTRQPIDTSKYKYLTLRYRLDGTQDTSHGWVGRLIWWNQGTSVDLSDTKPFVIDDGWNTYTLDLTKAYLEPALADGTPANYGWKGMMKFFRLDPGEVAGPTTFHLQYMKLTGDDVAGDSYTIDWTPSGNSNATVNLYWSSSNQGTNDLQAIATGLPASAGSYTWDTRPLRQALSTSRSAYIYATIQDGLNVNGAFSDAPVTVQPKDNKPFRLYLPVVVTPAIYPFCN